MKHRLWIAAILGLLILTMFGVFSASMQQAAQVATATPPFSYVNRDNIYVRGGPSEFYQPVGSLRRGDRLQPLSRNAEATWVLIAYYRGYGWVRRDLGVWFENIDALPEIDPENLTPTPSQPETFVNPVVPTSTPEGNWINTSSLGAFVRTGPGLRYPVYGELPAGTLVEPVGRNIDTSWVLIRMRSGFAWINRRLVHWVTDLESLPVLQVNALTPSATFTQTDTPTQTPTPTVTPTVTDTATNTATFTATASATSTSTETLTSTATETASPTFTATDTSTIIPSASATLSSTPTSTATDTANPTQTATPSPTNTVTASQTYTAVPESSANTPTETSPAAIVLPTYTTAPSDTPTSTFTGASTVTQSATVTNTAEATATSSATASVTNTRTAAATTGIPPAETSTPTATATMVASSTQTAQIGVPSVSATSTLASAVTDGGEPAAQPPTPSELPIEALVGGGALLLVLGYAALYWRGLGALERYQSGFIIERCPACGRGHLEVETHQTRVMGVPRARYTVRCDNCRSVLRSAGQRQWRYAVDRMANPALFDQYNNKTVDEETLKSLANGEGAGKPAPKPHVRPPTTPPTFIDIEGELQQDDENNP